MDTELHTVLHRLLTESPTPAVIETVADWWRSHLAAGRALRSPLHRAILGGFLADRVGYAFASGYREALCFAIPDVGERKLVLCASEKTGAHPRFIKTGLTPDASAGGFRLNGAKEYASLGTFADGYIVIASVGTHDDGRNHLAAIRVPKGREGITLTELPPTPFIPEIPHARLTFDNVPIEPHERLPGDGYSAYLKPFRTIEDIHVHGALIAYILQIARRCAWPRAFTESAISILISLSSLVAGYTPGRIPIDGQLMTPWSHIALAGVLKQAETLFERAQEHFADIDEPTRERWRRDRPLTHIANKARARRREVAWTAASNANTL